MFYKVIYNNIIIDILNNPTWVRWLGRAARFILADSVSANGVVSSDGQSVYNLAMCGPFENTSDVYKSVTLIEVAESEYNFIKAQIVKSTLSEGGEIITLAMARDNKIKEMRAACEAEIVSGFDVVLSDGLLHHFTLDIYDQLKITKLYAKATEGVDALPYHADGEVCKYFSWEDISSIYTAMESLIEYHTAYFNSMRVYICNIFNVETIMALSYGDTIPAEYHSTVFSDLVVATAGGKTVDECNSPALE